MGYELIQPTGKLLLPGPFWKRFKFSEEWDKAYTAKIAGRAKQNICRIHLLVDTDGNNYGFVAVSFATFNNRCSLVIEFLFTSRQYRGVTIPDLGGKVSDVLIDFVVKTAADIVLNVPVKYVSLLPANEKLRDFYSKKNFQKIDSSDWMILPVPTRPVAL